MPRGLLPAQLAGLGPWAHAVDYGNGAAFRDGNHVDVDDHYVNDHDDRASPAWLSGRPRAPSGWVSCPIVARSGLSV